MQHTHGPSFPRVPALDGLRGAAVAGVLAYHAGFGWARGGFLGVSLFFTLSGYLITSLLLHEHATTGRIRLGVFWVRRARRLLPAAVVALAGIVVFGATVAGGSQLRALRGDVLGALGYVANWRFVAAGTSYGDLWSAPSPVQHFWSLAIEEQLYVVLPLAVVGALTFGRGRRSVVGAVLATGLLASLAATFLVDDQLRAYYGTDVRAAELLVGALVAVVVAARPEAGSRSRTLPVAGTAALVALAVAWVTTSQSSAWLYDGGLLAHAALATIVIAAVRRGGLAASLLTTAPLRWLGRISYGAYLYHWPLFLWLDPARTGLDGTALAVLRVAASLALAALSAALLEEPIRERRRLAVRSAPAALAASLVAVTAALMVVTATPPPSLVPLDVADAPSLVAPSSLLASSRPADARTDVASAPAELPSAPAAPVARTDAPTAPARWDADEPLRVYVAGDSNAYILGLRLLEWGRSRNVEVWASGWFACHIVPGGTYRWAGQPKHTEEKCNRWPETRAHEIARIRPHVALVLYGSFDVLDRKWDGSDAWTHIGLPDFDRALKANIDRMTDVLGAAGARVVWTTYPRVRSGIVDGVPPATDWPETADHRVDRLNTFIRQSAASRRFAEVLDLRRTMQAWPNGELDPVRRPDGIHPSEEDATAIASWLGEQLLVTMSR